MSLNFASRAEQAEFVRQAIIGHETGTIIITGEPGMGRTTFLARAVRCADGERDELRRLSPSGAARFTRDAAQAAVGGETGRRFVIAVDDVQRIDYSSLLVLRRLARCGRALLLVTRPQASGRPDQPDPSSCLAHDRDIQTITLLPLSVPEVAAALAPAGGSPVSRSAAAAVRAATGGNPSLLRALVARTTEARVPAAPYPGAARLVTTTWDAWRGLALDRTDQLCRLALRCGARDEVAPIWAMLLLLRGRTHECMAFLRVRDVAGPAPPQLAVVRALALALGFGQPDEASGHLLESARGGGKPIEFLLAFRAWLLAISGGGARVTAALADLSRQDYTTALFVHAARAVQAGLSDQRAESVFHLRRAIAAAEASSDDYPWVRPYLQASLIDALMLCGRGKEAASAAQRFHAHEPSSGWEIAVSLGSLLASRATPGSALPPASRRDPRGWGNPTSSWPTVSVR